MLVPATQLSNGLKDTKADHNLICLILSSSNKSKITIRKFVGSGFKIRCSCCKTFNIVYPQYPDYVHPFLEPWFHKDSVSRLAMFKCIASERGPDITGINVTLNDIVNRDFSYPVTTEDNTCT